MRTCRLSARDRLAVYKIKHIFFAGYSLVPKIEKKRRKKNITKEFNCEQQHYKPSFIIVNNSLVHLMILSSSTVLSRALFYIFTCILYIYHQPPPQNDSIISLIFKCPASLLYSHRRKNSEENCLFFKSCFILYFFFNKHKTKKVERNNYYSSLNFYNNKLFIPLQFSQVYIVYALALDLQISSLFIGQWAGTYNKSENKKWGVQKKKESSSRIPSNTKGHP